MSKKVFKYATGEVVPEDAVYLYSTKNGVMGEKIGYMYVWHYFLVEVEE